MSRFVMLLAIAGLALLAVACTSGDQSRKPPTPLPDPADFRMSVNDEVQIRFAIPYAVASYPAAIFVEHTPTSSYVRLDRSGRATAELFETPDARAALCAVLADKALMLETISRSAERSAYVFIYAPLEPHPCQSPLQPGSWEPPYISPWPEEYTLALGLTIEIQFAYPHQEGEYIASIFVRHMPSSSVVGVNRSGIVSYERVTSIEARVALCGVLLDEALMSELLSRAKRIDPDVVDSRALAQGPCENLSENMDSLLPLVNPENLAETLKVASGPTARFDLPEWPPVHSRSINTDVEVRLAYRSTVVDWEAPIAIWHIPSSSSMFVDLQGRVISLDDTAPPEAIVALCAVFGDEQRMVEVRGSAKARADLTTFWTSPDPLDPDPCEEVLK